MKSNKSPGYDGLPVEYYKFFWDHIEDLYMKFAGMNVGMFKTCQSQ